MEIILVCITNPEHGGVYYPGILDAIKADEARSGCRVWCISDISLPCKNFIPLGSCSKSMNELRGKTNRKWSDWGLLGIKRNLIVHDFVKSRNDLTWPIFPMDNDILIFSNLEEVYKPLLNNDFCSAVYERSEIYGIGGTAGAYSIHNMDCFNAGIDLLLSLINDSALLTDMVLWSKMYQSGKWKVGNILSKFEEGGAFDSNIHVSENRYIMEPSTIPMWGPETKKIIWKDGHPYFTEISDGSLTLAHWIHCWGSYKFRTKELIERAGL